MLKYQKDLNVKNYEFQKCLMPKNNFLLDKQDRFLFGLLHEIKMNKQHGLVL